MSKTFTHILFFLTAICSIPTLAQNHTDCLINKSYKEIYNISLELLKTDSTNAKKALNIYVSKAKKNYDTLKIASGLFYHSQIVDEETKMFFYDTIINITKNKQTKKHHDFIYYEKGRHYLYEKRNIEIALKNLTTARIYAAQNNNTNLLYKINYLIGIIKSEHLGEKEDAITIFKKCADYYIQEKEYSHKFSFLYTTHVTAETYIGLKKYDSATYYNTLGYLKTSKSKDPYEVLMKNYFSLCEGINQYERSNFSIAIDSISTALPQMIIFEDKSNIIDSYFYLGQSYYNLQDNERAIFYFKKTDSILETLTSIPQYKHIKTYEYLKNYYTKKEDIKNQNKYLNKLNSILDNYINDKIYISTKVKEDYDVPVLLDEQKEVIKKLSNTNNTYTQGITILVILMIILGIILYFQYKKKKVYRLRFEQLMNEQKSNSKTVKPILEDDHSKDKKTLDVPEKHVTDILTQLQDFEDKKGYLINGMSSQSLAESMNTNVKYLSKVINHYKNKTFTKYLNELRITHAVNEMKQNNTLQKYTIKAIAEEMGYNSAETFSNAFFKQVGIKPSYFMNQLKKQNI